MFFITLIKWKDLPTEKLKAGMGQVSKTIEDLEKMGIIFSFSPEEGYKGLMTGKPIATIYARGGAYGSGTGAESYDLQKAYLEHILAFIGFSDFQTILVEPTLVSPEDKEKIMEAARERAKAVAAGF